MQDNTFSGRVRGTRHHWSGLPKRHKGAKREEARYNIDTRHGRILTEKCLVEVREEQTGKKWKSERTGEASSAVKKNTFLLKKGPAVAQKKSLLTG